MSLPPKLTVMQDESDLIIAPSCNQLEKELFRFQIKELAKDPDKPWQRKVSKKVLRAYEVEQTKPFRVIRTYQGYIIKLLDWCRENGVKVDLHRNHSPFPKPDLKKMWGFRGSQEEWFVKGITKNMSGLFGACTRYGKSRGILNTCKVFPKMKTVITLPGKDLVAELYEKMKEGLPHREVVGIGSGFRTKAQSDDITVCSVDSLHRMDKEGTKLLILDEPHAAVSDSRFPELAEFVNARKYGFGATLDGRFDGKDCLLEGLIGPVLTNKPYTEAVKEKMVAPIRVILITMPTPTEFYHNRDRAYKELLYMNPKVAAYTKWLCEELLPEEWQTLLFIKTEKQADYMLPHIGKDGRVAMAKKLKAKERKQLYEEMAEGSIKRCLASDIYAQGVTFSDLRVMINLSGGGPYNNSIQKPGRLCEIRDDKKCGFMFDFVFPYPTRGGFKNGASMVSSDSQKRYELYKKTGYDVCFAKNTDEIRHHFERP